MALFMPNLTRQEHLVEMMSGGTKSIQLEPPKLIDIQHIFQNRTYKGNENASSPKFLHNWRLEFQVRNL